jgi:hypothetical protein
MVRLKTIITALLLSFVAVSVGHLAGQELGLWDRPAPASPESRENRDATLFPAGNRVVSLLSADRVTVYYLHDRQRCDTCLRTERMTLDLLGRDFAAEMTAGRVEWKPLVIEDNAAAARRYGAASSSVVVAEVRGGREQTFTLMDDLWKLLDAPARFDARVGEAIRKHLPGDGP